MRRLSILLVVLLTLVAGFAVAFGLRLNPDVASLLPSEGSSAVLARYLKGFGGGGLSAILIEGEPEETMAVADAISNQLAADQRVAFSASRLEIGSTSDPLLAWRFADERGRAALAAALEPTEMRVRLQESKKLLLMPGAGAASEALQKDPLRLASIPLRERNLGAGVRARDDGYFATDDGRAHLVVVKPKGFALRGADARAFASLLDGVLASQRELHPQLSIRATGPHVISSEMEKMLRSDLELSGVVSTVMASLAFLLVFRRLRALAAILPALLLGTLWTTAIAALFPKGLSAIAVAFMSIVVGVGFDSGVHVYAAFLQARSEGHDRVAAAQLARKSTARPVLSAALIAATAFACLGLSSVQALRELGILCAAGEVLTAISILLLTPELARLFERSSSKTDAPPRYAAWIHAVTGTRARAAVVLGIAVAVTFSSAIKGVTVSQSLVAVRPNNLPSLLTEDRIFELFGGRHQPFIVMVSGPERDAVMARADELAERLAVSPLVETVDALGAVIPAEATQQKRLEQRDAIDLTCKASELEQALKETGFAPARFESALAAMREAPRTIMPVDDLLQGDRAVVAARYLAADEEQLAVLHVHTKPGVLPNQLDALVAELDGKAQVTGYAKLEADLRTALQLELPKIGAVAGALVLLLLALSLRNLRELLLAAGVLVVGLGALFGLIGLFEIPLHIYSALVIPVLIGISVDEAMFLLHHARGADEGFIRRTLELETRPVVTTALTTSAGLFALCFAKYDGLRHLGIVGAVGNVTNLITALLLVPAGLRLFGRPLAKALKPTVES